MLIVAGSPGMSGAAVLCGSACLRGGAGLVRLAVPASVLPLVAIGNPCYMSVPLAQEPDGSLSSRCQAELRPLLEDWATVVAVGPGLGQPPALPEVVSFLVRNAVRPLVIDADGLNALATLEPAAWRDHPGPIVLTPHPGEFARLVRRLSAEVQANREELACTYAREQRVILVLKGHQTIVTDGERTYVNRTGNPGMATGGTGDVLTGLIAALAAQSLSPFEAAVLGVWVHGRAGDLASDTLGQTALIASDLLAYLPAALREVGG